RHPRVVSAPGIGTGHAGDFTAFDELSVDLRLGPLLDSRLQEEEARVAEQGHLAGPVHGPAAVTYGHRQSPPVEVPETIRRRLVVIGSRDGSRGIHRMV